jgi:hypothetical protein
MYKRYRSYNYLYLEAEGFFKKLWSYVKILFESREVLRNAHDYKTEIKVMNAKRYFTIPRGWKEKARICVTNIKLCIVNLVEGEL